MSELTLELPYPPSVNTIWRCILHNGQPRTLLSKKGRQWRHEAKIAIWGQVPAGAEPFDSLVEVVIDLYPPSNRKIDIDNPVKATLDAITHAGCWSDDSQVKKLTVIRHGKVPGGRCDVRIKG